MSMMSTLWFRRSVAKGQSSYVDPRTCRGANASRQSSIPTGTPSHSRTNRRGRPECSALDALPEQDVHMTDPERADLLDALAKHRGFMARTVRGITDEQAAQRT